MEIFVAICLLSLLLVLIFPAFRKALGLLLIILGVIASLHLIGLVIGIPMILIGGILLFAKRREGQSAGDPLWWVPPMMRVDKREEFDDTK